jgi:hypothetical protein
MRDQRLSKVQGKTSKFRLLPTNQGWNALGEIFFEADLMLVWFSLKILLAGIFRFLLRWWNAAWTWVEPRDDRVAVQRHSQSRWKTLVKSSIKAAGKEKTLLMAQSLVQSSGTQLRRGIMTAVIQRIMLGLASHFNDGSGFFITSNRLFIVHWLLSFTWLGSLT